MLDRGMARCYILGATGGNEKARRSRGVAAQSHGTLARHDSLYFAFRFRVKASALAGLPKAEEVFGFLFGDLIMTFKKSLRTKNDCQAQATLEYFIVLAVIALITIVSLSAFHRRMLLNTQGRVDASGNVITSGFFQTVVLGTHGLNVENN